MMIYNIYDKFVQNIFKYNIKKNQKLLWYNLYTGLNICLRITYFSYLNFEKEVRINKSNI